MIPKTEYTIIPLVIYPFEVMVSFHKKFKDLEKVLKEKLPEDCHKDINLFDDESDAKTIQFSNNCIIIHYRVLCHRTIAHEIFHAADFLLRTIKITLSDDSDEAYAYLIGYLTEEIYKIIEI